jgi:uncharacterized protein (TIGR02246 family)
MNDTSVNVVRDAFATLESAWNDADGTRFGDPFTDDADFIDIRGTHHTGRRAIAGGHDAILRSIYEGSKVRYHVKTGTPIADGCVLGIIEAVLEAPTGPLRGTHNSTITAVFTNDNDAWKIRSFHNTLVMT